VNESQEHRIQIEYLDLEAVPMKVGPTAALRKMQSRVKEIQTGSLGQQVEVEKA